MSICAERMKAENWPQPTPEQTAELIKLADILMAPIIADLNESEDPAWDIHDPIIGCFVGDKFDMAPPEMALKMRPRTLVEMLRFTIEIRSEVTAAFLLNGSWKRDGHTRVVTGEAVLCTVETREGFALHRMYNLQRHDGKAPTLGPLESDDEVHWVASGYRGELTNFFRVPIEGPTREEFMAETGGGDGKASA